jgi:hypothetical protein
MQMRRFDGSDWLAPAAAVQVSAVQARGASTPLVGRLVIAAAAFVAALLVAVAWSAQANASTSRPTMCGEDASWSSGTIPSAFRPRDEAPCSKLAVRLARQGRRAAAH